MKLTTHLIISRTGNVRVNKTGSGIKPNEIDVEVRLDIPDKFFRRPQPVVNIAIPDTMGDLVPTDAVLSVSAATVAEALDLDVTRVRDGLALLLAERGGA